MLFSKSEGRVKYFLNKLYKTLELVDIWGNINNKLAKTMG
jgi:hypothetical protein